MTDRRASQEDLAYALAQVLFLLDRLETLERDEIQEAARTFAAYSKVSRAPLFEQKVARNLSRLRLASGSWSQRRAARETNGP